MRTMNSVLLVEDFGPFRAFVSTLLREKPDVQVVSEASDGLEAVRRARELHPDLILMDIGLPGLNGIEAARRIRELAPRSRIRRAASIPFSPRSEEHTSELQSRF